MNLIILKNFAKEFFHTIIVLTDETSTEFIFKYFIILFLVFVRTPLTMGV